MTACIQKLLYFSDQLNFFWPLLFIDYVLFSFVGLFHVDMSIDLSPVTSVLLLTKYTEFLLLIKHDAPIQSYKIF